MFTKLCMKWLTSMSNITAARPVPRKMWKIAEMWTEKNGQTFHFHFLLLSLFTAPAHQGWGLTFVQSNSNCADDEHWTCAHWNSMQVIWMACSLLSSKIFANFIFYKHRLFSNLDLSSFFVMFSVLTIIEFNFVIMQGYNCIALN